MPLTENISTLRLFKESGVTGFSNGAPSILIGLLGWSLAATTMYFYTAARSLACSAGDHPSCAAWTGVLGSHVLVMALVAVEAIFTTGFFWPLQMAIIGFGSFITFLVTALVGGALGLSFFVRGKKKKCERHH